MVITQESAVRIILRALETLNEERDIATKVPVGVDTALFGSDSALDSLSLVSVIVDVEAAVSDEAGESISLMNDQALSQEKLPFADVRTLSAYIVKLTSGRA